VVHLRLGMTDSARLSDKKAQTQKFCRTVVWLMITDGFSLVQDGHLHHAYSLGESQRHGMPGKLPILHEQFHPSTAPSASTMSPYISTPYPTQQQAIVASSVWGDALATRS
jgi:hypothetical protein